MSNKCEHNNHSHSFLWFWVWWLMMDACTAGSCSGSQSGVKNDIRRLESKVQQLEYQCNSKK